MVAAFPTVKLKGNPTTDEPDFTFPSISVTVTPGLIGILISLELAAESRVARDDVAAPAGSMADDSAIVNNAISARYLTT
jgi:hypothetical protein